MNRFERASGTLIVSAMMVVLSFAAGAAEVGAHRSNTNLVAESQAKLYGAMDEIVHRMF